MKFASEAYFSFAAMVMLLFQLSGCIKPKKEVRAFIEPTGGWKLVENCGYQGCYPLVDYLMSGDATVRIEVIESSKLYLMRLIFSSVKPPIVFNTASIKGLVGTEIITAKVFFCDTPELEFNSLPTLPPLINKVSITGHECFLLFFDHPFFLSEKIVTLDMRDALFLDHQAITIPVVKLKRMVD